MDMQDFRNGIIIILTYLISGGGATMCRSERTGDHLSLSSIGA